MKRLGALLLALTLAGCQGIPFFALQATQTPPPPTAQPTSRATQAAIRSTPIPTPDSSNQLVVWVPPQFNPDDSSPSGQILKTRLDTFTNQNPGVTLSVRVKPVAGPGSLLDGLVAASAAAPGALPDLIALPSDDLRTAALKGLLYPLDGSTSLPDDADWYPFARQLSDLQGSTFGLPFTGDALVLLYRPGQVQKSPTNWDNLLGQPDPFIFPIGDNQALFTLAEYQAAGGQIQDAQNRPLLSAEILSRVLGLYQAGLRSGIFPAWSIPYDSNTLTWQAFHDQKANMVVTWISNYLNERPPDTTIAPLPAPEQTPLTYATGWLWGVSSVQPDRRVLATKLAEYLVDSSFLADWTASLGYIPPRPAALAGWPDQSIQALVSQVAVSAQARPSTDLLLVLGPVIKDAVIQVLKEQADPVQAANQAIAHLNPQ